MDRLSNSVRLIAFLGLAFGLSTLLIGCAANKVQAPFDSFVCFNSTFNRCLDTAQGGQLKALQKTSFKKLVEDGYLFQDTDAGKIVSTKDGKYQCQYGTVPYTQTLLPEQLTTVVFVSPVLLRQLGEQQLRLTRARTACERLVQAYGYQLDILALQDKLSVSQKAISQLTSELEHDRSSKEDYGSRTLTSGEAALYGISEMALRDALKVSRDNAVTFGEQLRTMYKIQVTDVDYKKQFADANLTVELQLRELGRNLFILDRSISRNVSDELIDEGYADGSWVKQGTIVVSTRKQVDH